MRSIGLPLASSSMSLSIRRMSWMMVSASARVRPLRSTFAPYSGIAQHQPPPVLRRAAVRRERTWRR